jgi:serine/threonine protein kinase
VSEAPAPLTRFGAWEILERRGIPGGGFDALARDATGREVRLWAGRPGSGTASGPGPTPPAASAALSKVYHASLPRVIAGAVAEDRAVLAVAPYRGRTLEERLLEGPLPVPEALDAVRTVAAGLVKAHRAGATHGALDAGEILLAEDGRTLLLHVGFGAFLGPRPPRAPEDAAEGPRPEASDVFGLSRVLLECLLGRDPVEPGGGLGPGALPPEWPEGLRRFLARSVSADATRRIHRAEEFAGDLAVIRASWEASSARGGAAPAGPDRRIVLAAGLAGIVAAALAARSCGP